MTGADPTANAAVFALLDDREASAEHPTSRLYTGFVRLHACADDAGLNACWAAVEADQCAGLHAVLLADYEWGETLVLGTPAPAGGRPPALRVLMFERLQRLSLAQATAWLQGQAADAPAGTLHLQPSVDEAAFTQAIDRIHEAIRAGETYQVNYTYRLHGQAWGEPVALFRALRRRQPVAFGALIRLPRDEWVLSCSPELFLRQEAGVLSARPMKGTAARIREVRSDSETARLLSLDTKNRAENLMIVDLLRNDIGRIAQTGSVQVPALFAIEPYATVFQMTSTITARLRPDVDWPTLLRATFPCGSITGAPKHRTMQLIRELEGTPRGLYCGAIGWLDAPPAASAAAVGADRGAIGAVGEIGEIGDTGDIGARGDIGSRGAIGDFCLSVAIRTLTLGPPAQGLRPLTLGIGAGIVLDSVAADELAECRLKARFLTALDPGFELFETMLHRPGSGLQHTGLHLARLAASATALGFAFDAAAARALLDRLLPALPADTPARVRLALAHDGRLTLTHAALPPLPAGDVSLLQCPAPLPRHDPLAAHKTTRRAHYDAGVRAAEAVGAFDSLFFDTAGQLVEGGRSSVFLRIGGRWFTPPVAAGALPGIQRGLVLADPAWAASERTLDRDDLARAEAIVVCNALRGVLPARLQQPVAEVL